MYPTVPAAKNLRGRRGDWTPAGWLVYNFPPRCPLDPRPTLHPWPAEERHVAAPLALAAGASQGLSLRRHDRPAAPLSCTPIFTPDLPRSPLTGWKSPHHRFQRDRETSLMPSVTQLRKRSHGDVTGHRATALPLEKQPGLGQVLAEWVSGLPCLFALLPSQVPASGPSSRACGRLWPRLSAYEPAGSAALGSPPHCNHVQTGRLPPTPPEPDLRPPWRSR